MRKRKRILALVLSLIFVICDIVPSSMVSSATSTPYPVGYKGMGDITHYNGITFGDYHAERADVEGAIAIQGNFNAPDAGGGFDITTCRNFAPTVQMGHEYKEDGYPCFLLGGKLSSGSPTTLQFLGDYMTVGESSDPDGLLNGKVKATSPNIIYEKDKEIEEHFKELRKQVDEIGNKIDNINPVGQPLTILDSISIDRNGLKFSNSNYSNTYVSNLPDSETLDLSKLDIYYPTVGDNDVILIKSNAKTVDFGGSGDFYEGNMIDTGKPQNSILQFLADRVIWYFPEATTITSRGKGIVGSVVAPNADVKAKGGSVNGQLFCKSLDQTGGFELHNFSTTWSRIPGNSVGSIKIVKKNEDGQLLKNAEFKIYKDEQCTDEYDSNIYKTDENGVIQIDNLPLNKTYYIKEVTAPKGYKLENSAFKVELNAAIVEQVVTNQKDTSGSVKLIKKDKDTNELLKGVGFDLYNSQNQKLNTNTLLTDENGEIKFNGLSDGNYYFVEVSSLDGYVLDNIKIPFTIDTSSSETKAVQLTATNKKIEKANVKLIKTDSDTDDKLQGAKFKLYKNDDSEYSSTVYTTDSNGEVLVKDLPYGEYYFKEIEAPKGYKLNTEKISVSINSSTEVVKNVKNELFKGKFKIVKSDKNTGDKLQGAKFKIYDSNKNEYNSTEYTTNANGEIDEIELPYGDYYYKEIQAPYGYELDSEYHKFTISDEQVKIENVTNTAKEGSVRLVKVDSETNEAVVGAGFDLYKEDGTKVGNTRYTPASGEFTISNLEPGKYYFVESVAPIGYEKNNTKYNFEIKIGQAGAIKITAENDIIKGSAEIVKKDSETDELLDGAKFDIYNSNNEKINNSPLVASNGKVTVSDLRPGDYYAVETEAPVGYKLSDKHWNFTITKSDTSNGTVKEVEVTNDAMKGNIKIVKKSAEYNTVLQGAKFDLYNSNNEKINTNPLVTDEQGKIEVSNLRLGDYYFVETEAPIGYKLDTTPISLTISSDGQTVEKEIKNNIKLGSVRLVKTDSDTGDKLQGAKFKLYKNDDSEYSSAVYTTDSNGEILIADLPYGEYYFKEIEAPKGYKLNTEKISVSINSSTEVVKNVKNELFKGKFKIVKSDKNTGDKLQGAKFKIYDSNKNEYNSTEYTTNANGEIDEIELPYGDYYYKEIQAPYGYELDSEYHKFTISDEQVKIENVTNTAKEGSVRLVKVDSETKEAVVGAGFDLYKEDGTKVGNTQYTPASGEFTISNLEPGKYYFVESVAPAGYNANDTKYNFEIKLGQTGAVKIIVKNDIIKGSAEIIKKDSETGTLLDGAKFDIYNSNNEKINNSPLVASNGKVTVSDLRPGDYYAVETEAPVGYKLSDKHWNFTITKSDTSNGTVKEVEVTNDAMKGNIKIVKKSAEYNTVLQGAKFDLYNSNNEKINTNPLVTDEQGKIEVSNLRLGDYYFVETEAPIGYKLDATPINLTISSDGQTVEKEVVNNAIRGSAQLTKTEEGSTKLLSGAQYQLFNADGTKYSDDVYTTDENGVIKIDNLVYGDYYFEEVQAPAGYELDSTPVKFTISENGAKVSVSATNKLIAEKTGAIRITKKDADSKAVLAGAEFDLYNSADVKVNDTSLVTDKNGQIYVDGLKSGSYYLVETKAPMGYKLNGDKIVVEVDTTKELVTDIEVTNKRKNTETNRDNGKDNNKDNSGNNSNNEQNNSNKNDKEVKNDTKNGKTSKTGDRGVVIPALLSMASLLALIGVSIKKNK